MGASKQVEYRPSFRVNYLSFSNVEVTPEQAQEIVQRAYDSMPWFEARRGTPNSDLIRYRVQPHKVDVTISLSRTITDSASYEFIVSLATRVTPNQLWALEQYRADFARVIRDLAPPGFWNANVEVHLQSAEPFSAFAADTRERMEALSPRPLQ